MNICVTEQLNKGFPGVKEKLELSRRGAEKLVLREIRCPNCGFHLLDVYGTDHHYTRVKCRKCKFEDVIDTALFRTVKCRKEAHLCPERRYRQAR